MCGSDGALGRYPVGIQAAHVMYISWHHQHVFNGINHVTAAR